MSYPPPHLAGKRPATLLTNAVQDYATTVTSAGTLILTNTSQQQQYFTGATTHTVVLPVVSTLVLGQSYQIVNESTSDITVQSSGLNTIAAVSTGTTGIVTCVLITGTNAASWAFRRIFTSLNIVLDSAATPTYPASGDVKGVWYGLNTKANAFDSTCVTIGPNADTGAASATSVGNAAAATGSFSVAVGVVALASAQSAVAIGASSSTQGVNSISIGAAAACIDPTATSGIAIGTLATSAGTNSIAIGNTANDGDANGIVVIGNGAFGVATASNGIAIGTSAQVRDPSGIAIGLGAIVNGSSPNSLAIGVLSNSQGANSLAIGSSATDNDFDGVVSIGPSSSVLNTAHALGFGINAASVSSQDLGITLNGAAKQVQAYSSLYSTTVTAGLITALTSASAKSTRFSGSTTQTVQLPNTSTLFLGWEIKIVNDSSNAVSASANVTVDTFASTANITTLAGAQPLSNRGGWGFFQCISTAGANTAAEWSYQSGSTAL